MNMYMFSSSIGFDSLPFCGLWPTRFFCPWDFPGKDTGVGCQFLLQRIFPAQGRNLLLSCIFGIGRQILYHWPAWEALRTTQMPVNWWLDSQNVVYLYNRILLYYAKKKKKKNEMLIVLQHGWLLKIYSKWKNPVIKDGILCESWNTLD